MPVKGLLWFYDCMINESLFPFNYSDATVAPLAPMVTLGARNVNDPLGVNGGHNDSVAGSANDLQH